MNMIQGESRHYCTWYLYVYERIYNNDNSLFFYFPRQTLLIS